MNNEEIFLPEPKVYSIGDKKYIQKPLSAYNLIKLANLLSKALNQAMSKNMSISVLIMNMDFNKPDPAQVSALILTLISEVGDINEYLKYILKTENNSELAETDFQFLKDNLMPSQLGVIISDLVETNKDEIKRMFSPFFPIWKKQPELTKKKEKEG